MEHCRSPGGYANIILVMPRSARKFGIPQRSRNFLTLAITRGANSTRRQRSNSAVNSLESRLLAGARHKRGESPPRGEFSRVSENIMTIPRQARADRCEILPRACVIPRGAIR